MRRSPPIAGTLVASAAAAALAAAPAGAATKAVDATGTTRLTLGGPAATVAGERGVRTTAVAPATSTTGGSVVLPARRAGISASGAVGTIEHRGGLRLRLGTRSVVVSAATLKLGRHSTLRATVAGSSRALFTVGAGTTTMDVRTGRVVGRRLDLRLTASGAGTLSSRLGLRGARVLRAGRFARLTVDVRPTTAPAPATPAPAAAPAPASTAVPVVAATVVWRQRPSWLQYIETGRTAGGEPDPVGGTSALDGAVPGPVEQQRSANGSVVAIPYTYAFPFTTGWYDPATGRTSVSFGGGLRHRYADHTIDLTVRAPTIELNGSASRLVATVAGQQGAPPEGVRGAYVALDATKAQASRVGDVVTITGIPGTVPSGAGGSVFSGFYPDGDPYGSIDALQLTLGG